jgi:dTDP-4-amino-4,6-dideoxy-D-glucose transaminase
MKFYSNKPSIPNAADYNTLIESIFDSGFLTNFGQCHTELISKLRTTFQTENLALCNNATTALTCVIRSITDEKKTKVITTPFTFSATCHSIIWANKTPVFVDIEENGFNLCPSAVESAIDNDTAAIVPVHCYGFPCQLQKFDEISERYNIPIIYDAAHTFGIEYQKKSLVAQGSAAVVSTHATKAFNTAEGAIVYFHDEKHCSHFTSMTNFGIDSNGETSSLGLNAKLSELHAALGLLNLENFPKNVVKRHQLWDAYNSAFGGDSRLKIIELQEDLKFNFGYYPLTVIDPTVNIDNVISNLLDNDIIVRKYFSPILNRTKAFADCKVVGKLKNAEKLNDKVLCLPIHEDYLPHAQFIAEKVKRSFDGR